MAIVVNDMSTRFNVELEHESEVLKFTFKQLTYKEKNIIAGLTTKLQNGTTVIDSALTCFYVLKYGLEAVEGIVREDGTAWSLEKEKDTKINTDNSIDALLNSKISNGLIWAANSMLEGIPEKIINPITGLEVKGVSIVPVKSSKKKS